MNMIPCRRHAMLGNFCVLCGTRWCFGIVPQLGQWNSAAVRQHWRILGIEPPYDLAVKFRWHGQTSVSV